MAKKAIRSRQIPFDREKHVYKNDAFVELIKDAVRFFSGTPVHPLPPEDRFVGTGIYAIYYTGEADPYCKYAKLNRLAYDYPIYVGKAVPKGWRQSRVSHNLELKCTNICSFSPFSLLFHQVNASFICFIFNPTLLSDTAP
jgi:hypothetical protein